MAHKYELIVAWSREDKAFVVDVPELPGCMAHGATPAEAVANAQDAISLWLDTARELGLDLIRFRGHLPKGGYDVPTDGRHTYAPASPAIR